MHHSCHVLYILFINIILFIFKSSAASFCTRTLLQALIEKLYKST